MIVICRISNPEFHKVIWKSCELIGVRHKYYSPVVKEKLFNSFADANGFALGLQKKGVEVIAIEGLV